MDHELASDHDYQNEWIGGVLEEPTSLCDDCSERVTVESVQCPVDEDCRLDLCDTCYQDRGPGIKICHVQMDDWDVYGDRAPPRIEGDKKRHMNNTVYPESGWLGNPYPMEEDSEIERWRVLRSFKSDFFDKFQDDGFFPYHLGKLRGKEVACRCRSADQQWPGEGAPCHLDIVHAALLGLYRDEGEMGNRSK